MIIDEAHHSAAKSYTDIIDYYGNAKVLGVTATPQRSDGHGFKNYFDTLVTGISVAELIESNHLCKFRLFGAEPISTRGVSSNNGDYNLSQLQKRAMAIVQDVVPTWEKYAKGRQTLVFASGIDHSNTIVNLFNEAGYKAEHLDGETPEDERDAIIDRFKRKETMILSNFGVFTEGFDVPGIEAVQCVRPTRSLILWLQMVGRGLRPDDGKEDCIIIDHSDNWNSHGLPDEERMWSLDPQPIRKDLFTQKCPACSWIFRPLAHEILNPLEKQINSDGTIWTLHRSTCPSCGNDFEWQKTTGGGLPPIQATQRAGDITSVDVNTTKEGTDLINALIAVQQQHRYKPAWIKFQVMENPIAPKLTLGDWRYLGQYLNYKPGWPYIAFAEAQEIARQQQLP